MELHYDISLRTHEKVTPTIDEINEALADLIRKKIAESDSESKRVSTFTVNVSGFPTRRK
jgi:hypothetical protein